MTAPEKIYWDSCCFIALIQQEHGRFGYAKYNNAKFMGGGYSEPASQEVCAALRAAGKIVEGE